MTQNIIRVLKALNSMPGNTICIEHILLKFFPVKDKFDLDLVTEKKRALLSFLDNMQEAGLIKYISPKIGMGNIIDGYAWLDTTDVLASITKEGQEALAEYYDKRRITVTKILNYASLFFIARLLFKFKSWLKLRAKK